MPIIYLSPSTQEGNRYVTGTGSEEYWMNRLADAMIPYLDASGIRRTGWLKLSDGTYFVDPDTGAAVSGWNSASTLAAKSLLSRHRPK